MKRGLGRNMTLAGIALALALATASLSGQEFVVRDRLAEARERVVRERTIARMTEQLPAPEFTGTGFPGQAEPQVAPVQVDIRQPATAYTAVASPTVPMVQEPAPEAGVPTSSIAPQHATGGEWSVQVPAPEMWQAGEAYAAPGPGSWGELEPGPYDYSWRKDIPGVVLTNTHWFDGPRGEGYAAPFGYTSAYCRSGMGPEHDSRGNPSFCDEWKSPCGCSCCNEPFGLDIFKSRPYGPWPQKKHSCGCRQQCNGCAEGTGDCGGCSRCR